MGKNQAIEALIPEITEWRHWLHSCPEIAFSEYRTSDFIAEKLISFGLDVERGMAGTGVIGTLQSEVLTDEAIGLRADMDALKIQEENEVPYRSRNNGMLHACGHDGHMAMLLGAAKFLAQNKTFRGSVHFIFQPAEEKEGGARVMVEQGLFDKYPVKSVYAIHNFPILPFGFFATRKGAIMAGTDGFTIKISGTGGHTAFPHLAKDALVAAAQIVMQLQTIVSRNIDPTQSAVISVTDIHGGNNSNILPEVVKIQAVTRHFQGHVQETIEKRVKEIVAGVAMSMGLQYEIDYYRRYPAVVNSPAESDQVVKAAKMVVGENNVLTELNPVMASEDFAFMLQKKPGALIGIGYGTPKKGGMLHQSRYDFNDDLLPIGVDFWIKLVENILPLPRQGNRYEEL